MSLSCAVSGYFAGTAFADSGPATVAGTPCTAAARACVDLDAKKAWLIQNGKVVRGPVPIAAGGDGEETPTGDSFRVYRKDKDHKSEEFKLPNGKPAPMPWSVFFEDGGIAFHAGDPNKASAGCIHLNLADAQAFFSNLQIGDHVEVKDGSDSGDSDDNDSDSHDDNHGDDNHGDDNHGDDN